MRIDDRHHLIRPVRGRTAAGPEQQQQQKAKAVAVQGVGAGQIIAGRYTLNHRRARIGQIDVWSATDDTLGREVEVTVFPTSLPNAGDIVDAARRSAAIADHRFVRVLDVGSDITTSWLVEESLTETRTLAQLIESGPLPPEEARRIAGEVASALDTAAHRNVHHLHLTPHAVRLSETGLIKIAGLAIAAVIEGSDDDITVAEAERRDTRSVVALMYAVMTTRWPLANPVRGLDQAPRVGAGVAAPSELVVAVPPELDAVCRSTLNQGTGPTTPGELAAQLRPWSTTRVTKVSHRSAGTPDSLAATSLIPTVGAAGSSTSSGSSATAAPSPAPRPSLSQRRAEKRAARLAAERRELEERRAEPDFLDLPEALDARLGTDGRETHIAPGVPAVASRDGRYAKVILGVVGAGLLLATAAAVPVLWNTIPDSTSAAPPRTASPATSAPTTTSAPAAPTTTVAATPGAPLAFSGITGFDPDGDGSENESQAPRAIDGDPTTAWRSEGYRSAEAVGEGKPGVGLVAQLENASTVNGVRVTTVNAGHTLTVYTNTQPSLEGAVEVGGLTDAPAGENDVQAQEAVPDVVYVIVFVTGLPEENDGRYRASIAEVVAY